MNWQDDLEIPDALVGRYLPSEGLSELASQKLSEASIYLDYALRLEIALLQVLARRGLFAQELVEASKEAATRVTLQLIRREEERTRHDLKALVNVFAENCPAEVRPYIHLGATSYDILANAHLLRLREGVEQMVLPLLRQVCQELARLAEEHAATPQIGRTHGQYAEPLTFGYTMAVYLERLGTCVLALEQSLKGLRGKFSGAVGAYTTPGLLHEDARAIELEVLAEVGLQAAWTSTQITMPEPALTVLHHASASFGVLANLADDLRALQRSEIGEVAESYASESQVGSSAMPHKRNPITWENVKSLWKTFMPQMMTFYLDQVSEHQRDLTNSASARFLPRLLLGLAVAASRTHKGLAHLYVDREAMLKRLEGLGEVVSGPLQALLSARGVADAHEIIRKLSIRGRQEGRGLLDMALEDESLREELLALGESRLEALRMPQNLIGPAARATTRALEHWRPALGLSIENIQ